MSGYGGNSLSEMLYQQLSRLDSSPQEGQEVQSSIQSGQESLALLRPLNGYKSGIATEAESDPAWPLKPVISSGFGLRSDPITHETRFHSGVDIAAEKGTPVKAAMSGKVVMSCKMPDYGNVVAVDHGSGIVTVYAHNEKNTVKAGDYVGKGDVIGRVGSTGRSTGPHLHFEVRKNGVKIDPMEFMGTA
ncbi:MAG: M23 family metallopeptidase [Deltaproteobacteria bacterium]|nr:M23 family metallopeptidase [Deltaproteobacteria bacterium]